MDVYFPGGCQQVKSRNAENVMSRTGMVVVYANCPLYWHSLLQKEITLSTAEAEYIALSLALREILPLMTRMKKINKVFPLLIQKPNVVCQVHEDNQSCIYMATGTKISQ